MATKKSGKKAAKSAKPGSGAAKRPHAAKPPAKPPAPAPAPGTGRRKSTPALNVAAKVETSALTASQISARQAGTCLFINLASLDSTKAGALADFLTQQGIMYFAVAGTLDGG